MTIFEEFAGPGSDHLSMPARYAGNDGRKAGRALLIQGLVQRKSCLFTMHLVFLPEQSGPSVCLNGRHTELTKLTLLSKTKTP